MSATAAEGRQERRRRRRRAAAAVRRPKSAPPPEFLGRATKPRAPPVSRSWSLPPRNRSLPKVSLNPLKFLNPFSRNWTFVPSQRRDASGLAVWRPGRRNHHPYMSEEGAFHKQGEMDGGVDVTIFYFPHLIGFGLGRRIASINLLLVFAFIAFLDVLLL